MVVNQVLRIKLLNDAKGIGRKDFVEQSFVSSFKNNQRALCLEGRHAPDPKVMI